MQLVTKVRHWQTVDDLAEGGGFWVDVNGGKVVGFQCAGVAVDAGQVDDLLPGRESRKKT